MIACSCCGFDAPDDSAFCSKCGSKLVATTAAVEERKTVTTLFCDLVAFTAMSESADPEDVDALLGEYFARATKVIESHGGTVEKFIGDAVVGVFGVPATHEDDPERAVRAALRVLEALEGMSRPDGSPLEARCGVNTGEALVRLNVDPASGRGFLTGDAVNVAARLQAAAPPGGVAVGALSQKLTARVVGYEELVPIAGKGKVEPVAAWLALAPIARRGVDVEASGLSPFVGREVEFAYLSTMFDKATTQSTPQFALLVGEPGIGKSRLVRELLAHVDALPTLTTWRQGYCPPFGEDVTFWALAEMVRGHAGILDTDPPDAVESKLDAAVPVGRDVEWLRQRLRALVGLSAPDGSREENFTAWLRFFEEIAAERPTVLVFEDLHWADEALLSFLEHLTTHLASVPLLIVGTARPELFERVPGFASGGRVSRVGLEPLSPKETSRLVEALLAEERSDAVEKVVARCDGNPFYAEQSARLLADTAEDHLPDSVQAVIAARLDTLPAGHKATLTDAAVVGSIFWQGALAAVGGQEPSEVEEMLAGMLQRGLVRRIRESSMEGEREFAFVHALARDVAYAQLPRAHKALKHAAVARWFEEHARGGSRDLAALIAFHLSTAHDLAAAAGERDLAESTAPLAAAWLKTAGDSSQIVDVATAKRHYARALELASTESAERLPLLIEMGEVLLLEGDFSEAADILEGAMDSALESADAGSAVRPMLDLAFARENMGIDAFDLKQRALALAREGPPSRDLIDALDVVAIDTYLRTGDQDQALAAYEEAEALCRDHGLAMSPSILATRGAVRCTLGDLDGLEDYRRALEIAQAGASGRCSGFEVSRLMADYGVLVDQTQGPAASADVFREAIEFCERRGMLADALMSRSALLESRFVGGDWEGLPLALQEMVVALVEGKVALAQFPRAVQCILKAALGDLERLEEIADALAAPWDSAYWAYEVAYMAVGSAAAYSALGRPPAAKAALVAWAETPSPMSTVEYAWMVPEAVRIALRCSGAALAERLQSRGDGPLQVQQHVMTSVAGLTTEAAGGYEEALEDYVEAVSRWHDFGAPYEQAQALLGQGRCLVALGRASEAAEPLGVAREIFARLGARPAMVETDEWLTRTSAV